jgi:sigma-B regulation protein RsbU (phosphoserine phosphatase)
MNQHKLYRTIKELGEKRFRTDEQLLAHVLRSIIRKEEIPINGGRIWALEPEKATYRLVRQYGDMTPIAKDFRLHVSDYPPFQQLHRKGTVFAKETSRYLRRKGIKLYSATGVGERVPWKNQFLFQYVIGINADFMKDDMRYALNIVGNALTSALRNRTIESKARPVEADLDRAYDIQKSILPEHEMRFHHYDMYGISLPDRVVGGDFFDYLQAPDDSDRLGVVIGDAASKGLSAAAQALYVSGALRLGVEFQTKISTLVSRINQLVHKTFTPEQFISMVYTELTSSERGLVLYVNAGHSNPILLRGENDAVETLPATGQLIGPFPEENYHYEFTLMQKGDILLLYTDGIVEATNERQEMYGAERLTQTLQRHRYRTPKEVCQLILEEVQLYSRQGTYTDDKTLVVIKRVR